MNHDESEKPSPRRAVLKSFAVIPIAAAGIAANSDMRAQDKRAMASESAKNSAAYTPKFFDAVEWAFLMAACDRLIPHDEHGPGAVELGVPEFLDRHMQSHYAAGGIWYLEGPYLAVDANFGYQGPLPLRDILRTGIKAIDAYCAGKYEGKPFAQLDGKQQDAVLKQAEAGGLKLKEIPDKVFFASLLAEVRNGYFADPKYGGNKGMGAWKMIGYPGMRADYMDWVGVRDRPYPIGPVDLSGKRG